MLMKIIADTITLSRLLLSICLIWLGIEFGVQALPWVVWILLVSWTGDSLDGAFARHSGMKKQTWVGTHDLQFDMTVAAALLLYLALAGFVPLQIVIFYLLIWAVVFWRFGLNSTLGKLFQAPVYGWFIVVSIYKTPSSGLWILVWLVVAIALTWPRFPDQIIPEFIGGMADVWQRLTSHFRQGDVADQSNDSPT
jgi:phosphatidylglycerophosphate synthase